MRRIVLLFILVLFSSGSFGQNNDSLLRVYNNKKFSVEKHIYAANEFLKRFSFSNHDSSVLICKEMIAMSEKAEIDTLIALSYNTLGTAYLNAGKYKQSLQTFKTLFAKSKKMKLRDYQIFAQVNMSMCYNYMGDDINAIQGQRKVLEIADPEKDARVLVITNLELCRLLRTYDPKAALEYALKAVRLSKKLDERDLEAHTYSITANTYVELDQLKLASLYIDSALTIASPNFDIFIADLMRSKAVISLKKGAYDEGLEIVKKALTRVSPESAPSVYHSLKEVQGSLHLKKNEPILARDYCLEAYTWMDVQNLRDSKLIACKCLYQAYAKLNQPDKAYQYLLEYQTAKDSINSKQNTRNIAIAETEMKNSAEKRADSLKNAHKLASEKAKRKQIQSETRYQIIILITVLLFLTVFLIYAYNRFIVIKRQNTTIQMQKDVIRSEYETLKEFIENSSHELQTPMAIIQSKLESLFEIKNLSDQEITNIQAAYVATNRVSELNASLLLLTKIENNQFPKEDTVDVKAMVELLLEQLSDFIVAKNLKLEIDLQPCTLKNSSKILLDTVMSNLVSNSIKHNIENGVLKIQLTEKQFTIENTGKVSEVAPEKLFERFVKSDPTTKGIGLGLSIAKKSCEASGWKINYEQFENRHKLTVNF